MIIVTGGAGFIGSSLVAALNARGERDILVVDHLRDGYKMKNLADLEIADYLDRDDFIDRVRAGGSFGTVQAVLHQGACSATTEWDGQYMMRNNQAYSLALMDWCAAQRVPFIYASSASVYGLGEHGFREARECESPINVYAYSKFLFDQQVRRRAVTASTAAASQVVGLRYFNVYGPRESHKGSMASTALHFNRQVIDGGVARLFEGSGGYGDGDQRRDFIHVDDCVAVNLWFLDHPDRSGIYNVGTGRAQPFNDVAQAVIDWHGHGKIEYVAMPEGLKAAYQSYTEADLRALRACGYVAPFADVATGVARYLDRLNAAVVAARVNSP
ncbi:MAG: ADP-glyceromanno-heptose 6-epimerase [Pseudomonadota bacterium]|nr:ADP-glyceromanno-heptose 6-epimerase [Pseudomonadota bacterium]